MSAEASSPARGWLHCGLATAAASGLLALADGWLQPGMPAPLLRWPVMAFSILGAWTLCTLVLLLALPLLGRVPPKPSTGMALGVFIGAAPWMHSFMQVGDSTLAIALAHSASMIVALLVYWKFRPGPSLRLAAGVASVPAAVLVFGVLLPHSLPDVRSGAALAAEHDLLARGERPVTPRDAPDLVLISVDTLRADALIPDPARPEVPSAPVPFVQSLREGRALWATYALSSSDQTLPGHVGMLGGLDAFAHGVRSNEESPDPAIRFLAQELRDAGYRTGATVTNALIGRIHGMDRGYDAFSEAPIALATFGLIMTPWLDHHTWLGRCMPERWTAQGFARLFFRGQWADNALPLGARTLASAQAQLAELQRGEGPFFQFVHFMDPHTDYAPPSEWRGRLSAGAGSGLPPEMVPDEQAILHGSHAQAIETALHGLDAEIARRAAEYCRLVYLEEVMYVDDCLRRYVAAVEASGRPTIFLLTADHGEMFGEHGLMEHANGLWQENLRVPFLLWGANVPPGELGWIPSLAEVAPTLLTLAGLSVPPAMSGVPVLVPASGVLPNGARAPSALQTRSAPERRISSAQSHEAGVQSAGFQWIGAWSEDGAHAAALRAFDLRADPCELVSLAPVPPALALAAEDELKRDTWPQRVRISLSDALSTMLKKMGYAGQ